MRWTASYASRFRSFDRRGRRGLRLAVATVLLSAPAFSLAQPSAAGLYRAAQSAEEELHRSKSRLGNKSAWSAVAKAYRRVVLDHPQSGYSDDALYYEAEIYMEIERRFKDPGALVRALDAYLLLAKGYPASKWAAKARLTRGKVFLDRKNDRRSASVELRNVKTTWPNSSEAAEARRLLDRMERPKKTDVGEELLPPGIVAVRNIRHWTGREYTRIVIDIDREVDFKQARLADPDRIYFDLLDTRLSTDLASRSLEVEDGFLQRIRVNQNRPNVVRVVLDFKNMSEYNVFSLPDPYRLVVDILGTKPKPRPRPPVVAEAPAPRREHPVSASAASPGPAPSVSEGNSEEESEPVAEASVPDLREPPQPTKDGYSLARQLGLNARKILIDPGHGGHDPGTMSRSGLREKALVLDISRRVAKLLEEQGFEALLTRSQDVFIPLEERTAIANSRDADLFVSIHVNASRQSRARGMETYYLNLATSPDAEEVAARENAVTTRRLGELQSLLQKVMTNSKISESRELAGQVQGAMALNLLGQGKDPRNRGVKTAPFYVLLGAQMPAVLVEAAFLSNSKDEVLLNDVSYRQRLALSIANGILRYEQTLGSTSTAKGRRDSTVVAHESRN